MYCFTIAYHLDTTLFATDPLLFFFERVLFNNNREQTKP